jgi:DNA-binding NarL/FixJ family response regulator
MGSWAAMRTSLPYADLTPRQIEILCALLEGGSNRDIAARLGVREQTVKNQLSVMYERLGVQNRLQLALEGIRFLSAATPASTTQGAEKGQP